MLLEDQGGMDSRGKTIGVTPLLERYRMGGARGGWRGKPKGKERKEKREIEAKRKG